MTKYGIESTIVKVKSAHEDDDDAPHPGESTPLLSGTTDATTSTEPRTASLERMQMFQSFRRRSPQKLSHRGLSQTQLITTSSFDDDGAAAANQEDKLVHQQDTSIATLIAKTGSIRNGILATVSVKDLDLHQELASAQPIEGLAPLFPRGGIQQYDDRGYIAYREASLVKSVPAFPPYRRTARHRSFYLWWTNVSDVHVPISVCGTFIIVQLCSKIDSPLSTHFFFLRQ